MTSYYPNVWPATLRALLLRVDPVKPLAGDLHVLQRETVLLGFNVRKGGALEAVLLTPRAADETLLIADTSGRSPTWTLLDAPAPGGRWQFDRWPDVLVEVLRRFTSIDVTAPAPTPVQSKSTERKPEEAPAAATVDSLGTKPPPHRQTQRTYPGGTT